MDDNFIDKVKNKVNGGTPDHRDLPLCVTCDSAQTMQGYSCSQNIVWCRHLERQVPYPIYKCSAYTDKRQADIYDMKEIAWVLVTKKAGRDIGFISAKDYRKRKEDADSEE